MKVAIVILNWNGKALLEKFLPDVLENVPDYAQVYVIDNASSDDSVRFIASKFSSVTIIQNGDNYGFAKGYNEGLRRINADYFVLLNSDVQVTRNWIEPVIALMQSDDEIAACQPKILNYNVRNEFEYAGGGGGFIDKWGYPFCRGRIFNSFEQDIGQYNDVRKIFWASGACLFIRSAVYNEAGGLDEDFFAHMEEIDLCWRIRNLGYTVMFCPDSVVYHIGAGTLAKMNPQKTFYNFRNNLVMICKNNAPGFLGIKLLLRGILDGLAGIKFFFSGDFSHCIAVIRAHFSFYTMIGKTLKKRKFIQNKIKHYATGSVYRGSIVWAYFVKGKRKFSDLNRNLFY
ncbi:MAG: glycosyltransferase family 2 protein [Bacteroidetes bacterium]|nr:glycosyltransferase family 2 protein [Bacteroidota bacterium]